MPPSVPLTRFCKGLNGGSPFLPFYHNLPPVSTLMLGSVLRTGGCRETGIFPVRYQIREGGSAWREKGPRTAFRGSLNAGS